VAGLEKSREILRLEKKLTVDVLWLYVLFILKKKQTHAYVLRKKIEKEFGFLPGNVTAYVVLYNLEKRGFVLSKKQGNRKVYFITPEGKSLLSEAKRVLKEKQKQLFG
jgi:DNA-binding PadR family transcriptional regulator